MYLSTKTNTTQVLKILYNNFRYVVNFFKFQKREILLSPYTDFR